PSGGVKRVGILSELRGAEPGGGSLLSELRNGARPGLPGLRRAGRAWGPVLRELRHTAATDGGPSGRRPSAPRGRDRGAAAGVRGLRGPRWVHVPFRDPRSRGGPGTPHTILRGTPPPARAVP